MKPYRRAIVTDADALAAVGARAWRTAYRGIMPDAFLDNLNVAASADAWRRNLTLDDADTLIVERDGQVVGFCRVTRSRDPDADAATGELAAINIDPRWWRHGLGSALMDGVFECGRARGYIQVTLWVLEVEPRARRFYEARGFALDGARRVNEHWGCPLTQVRYRAGVFSDTRQRIDA